MEVRCGDHLQTVLRLSFLGLTLYLLQEEVALYCTVLYCTVLYCTVLYCTVLYRWVVTAAHCLHANTRGRAVCPDTALTPDQCRWGAATRYTRNSVLSYFSK